MLRDVSDLDAENFAFGHGAERAATGVVDVQAGPSSATATIHDAHLLFNSDFVRAGNDLILRGHDGGSAHVRDYFAADHRPTLISRDGAKLSGDLIDAMSGSVAPGQYAQAGAPAPAASDAVGRVVTASGDAGIIRNGVAVTLKPGDPVLRADVLQTQGGTMAVTFNDGSTLNLTANTRIVVSEFVYSPNGAGNSQLLNLVQGSLTFISGEVAHSGNMRIGTPVATMGIRGTVGGVTTANDGTVHFYVSQSATGAVIINEQGQIIANVVQDGPMIVVRPAGPLQVIAEEVQKSPAQLALELQALQQIVSIKAIGDQLLQQFFQQPNPNNPNPQSPQNGPHTQFQIDLHTNPNNTNGDDPPPAGDNKPFDQATVHLPATDPDDSRPTPVIDLLHTDLPPVTFAPTTASVKEDQTLTFSGPKAITLFDADSTVLKVTLTVTHGVLHLSGTAGLTFSAGNGADAATMTFTGSQAAINAALDGMTFTPSADYNGTAALTITTQDESSQPITTSVPIAVTPVNDAPVIVHTDGTSLTYTENDAATAIDSGLILSDVDSATLTGATVTISGNFHSGQDVLGFVNQHGITGSFDAQTGVLTLAGTASLADYQAALRSVTYSNTSENPSVDTRTVNFQVDDGAAEHSASNIVSTTVSVVPVNEAPVLSIVTFVEDQFGSRAYDLNSGTANWTAAWVENENGDYTSSPITGEIQVRGDPSISGGDYRLFLSDDDNESGPADTIQRSVDLSGATAATLTFDYRLQIQDGDPSDVVNVWASSNGTDFTLVGHIGATGYGAFVDAAYHQFSLDISGLISSATTIRFSVDDGVDDNDWFFIDNVRVEYSKPLSYSEDQAAAAIAPAITLSDVDSANLTGAKVAITGNFASSEDVLGFTNQNGITGSYNAQTGILTLAGIATLAQYQAALASVTYFNADALSTATRTISFSVDDGGSSNHTSNIASASVTVSAVDDHVTYAAADWVAFSSIDLGGGTNTLDVTGNSDISALGTPVLSHIATGNLVGTGGDDAVTLTGSQLDAIIIGNGTINLGAGTHDTINLTSTSADLNTLGITDASISGVEVVSASTATAGVTIDLHGQSEAFAITGSGFADTLTGGSGVDTINGGNGNDVITGGAGADVMTGGSGADTFVVSAVGDLAAGEIINGTAEAGAIDTLRLDAAGTYNLTTFSTITNIDKILFNQDAAGFVVSVNPSVVATADANGDGNPGGYGDILFDSAVAMTHGVTINTSGMNNNFIHVIGTNLGGDDILNGNGGADIIDGGAGSDTIFAGLGADVLTGGLGADTFTYNNANQLSGDTIDGTLEAGTLDTLRFNAAGSFNLATATISHIDQVTFNANSAGFSLTVTNAQISTADANGDGTTDDMAINASVAMSNGVTINASGLTGTNHIIVDGTNLGGNDTITGGVGNDTISGGAGNDTLTGGAGTDTFVFHAGFGNDTVTDYTVGTDILQFDSTLFANVTALLAATSDDGNGHAVITYDVNDTVTLNVSTATLSAHTGDIHLV